LTRVTHHHYFFLFRRMGNLTHRARGRGRGVQRTHVLVPSPRR
jgi:hypothetical protein